MKIIRNFTRILFCAALFWGVAACSSESNEPVPPINNEEPPLGNGDNPPVSLAIVCDAEEDWIVGGGVTSIPMRIVADQPARVEMSVDLTLEQKASEGLSPIPAEAVDLPEAVIFPENESEVAFEVQIDGSQLAADTSYSLAISIRERGGNAGFRPEDALVEVVVIRRNTPRAVRQILFFEVNNCNPLNALEYRLEDGSPFFDAVVLFAANINYNQEEDRVYLHNNPNVQALLDNSETLLQPLRRAGIKVYLGLLGNHDAAGLAQLSDWGAATWAHEVAETCATYGLDGVSLDDEYSKSPDLTNRWFAVHTPTAGARLAYELKRALAESCSWPTEVSVFEYGMLQNLPAVVVGGVSHPQSEFLDILIPNYGSASTPYGDLTYAQCCGASVEINYYGTLSKTRARNMLASGYGWCMWFGFDPSGSGGVKSNLEHSMKQFRNAASGFYEQDLLDPEFVYHKFGEGSYDPTPHPF